MERDFIIVAGMQGYGKSVWTRSYCRPKKRLLTYDPKGEHAVDFLTLPDDWVPDVSNNRRAAFRFGSIHAEEVQLLAATAYGATRCTLCLEECKMLFDRGEDVAPWARPLIYMGREPQIDLVLVAQRMAAIPPDIRSQASRIVTFLQTEKADCKAFSDRFGGDFEQEIRALPVLTCLDWQAGQGVRRYTVTPGAG
jgi:hypothetical protein